MKRLTLIGVLVFSFATGFAQTTSTVSPQVSDSSSLVQ